MALFSMKALVAVAVLTTGCSAFNLQPSAPPSSGRSRAAISRPACTGVRMGGGEFDRRSLLAASGALAAASVPKLAGAADDALTKQDPKAWAVHDGPFSDKEFADFVTTESGLKYKDVVIGAGAQPTSVDTVRLHYAGYLLNGQAFDTSYGQAMFPFSLFIDGAPPVAFKLAGGLLPGFIEGVLGMKVGGKRICLLKPDLAYGSVGVKGRIPPDSPLVFYLELRSIGSGIAL